MSTLDQEARQRIAATLAAEAKASSASAGVDVDLVAALMALVTAAKERRIAATIDEQHDRTSR